MTARMLLKVVQPWKRELAVALAAAVGAALCSVALAGTAAWLIATAAGRVPILTLMVAIVVVRACGIGRGVLRYLERLAGHDAVLRMFGAVRRRAVTGLAARVRSGRVRPGDADALAMITTDVEDLQDAVLRGLLPFTATVVVTIAAVTTALLIQPSAGVLLATVLLIAVLVLPALTAAATARRERLAVRLRGERDRQIGEILAGAEDLVVTGAWMGASCELALAERAERRVRVQQARDGGRILALAILATGLAATVAAGWGTVAVGAGRLDPVLLAVLVLLPLALTDLVATAGECGSAIGRTAAAAGRVLELLDESDLESDYQRPREGVRCGSGGAPVIRLHRVSARWPGTDRDALSEVDLELRAGRRVAVVGPSGSGKSTLVAVLLGLLPIRSGSITVDGRQLLSDSRALLGLMSWVPAEPHLFDSTIGRNVGLARPNATAVEVDNACAAAGLADWIARLPAGIDTRVGPLALAVSGGERQRIALARALLADRPVLLADEPAAHLDEQTAASVTAAVLAPDPQRCTLLVTHHLDDLQLVDAVLQLPEPQQPAGEAGDPAADHPTGRGQPTGPVSPPAW